VPHRTGKSSVHDPHSEAVQAGRAGSAVQGQDQIAPAQQLPDEGSATPRDRINVPGPTANARLKSTNSLSDQRNWPRNAIVTSMHVPFPSHGRVIRLKNSQTMPGSESERVVYETFGISSLGKFSSLSVPSVLISLGKKEFAG